MQSSELLPARGQLLPRQGLPSGGEAGRVLPVLVGLLAVGGEAAAEGRVLCSQCRPPLREVLRRGGEHGGRQRRLQRWLHVGLIISGFHKFLIFLSI